VQEVVVVQAEVIDFIQCGSWTIYLGDCDRAIQPNNVVGMDKEELIVQSNYLLPIGLLRRRGVGVNCGDGGLDLVRTRLVACQALFDQGMAFVDE
jgi:hypothetical protein